MSDKARGDTEGSPPSDDTEEHESWLREAVHAPLPTRIPANGDVLGGKYRVEDVLGRGGMGLVFRARHVVSEKTVALKWMLRPTSDEQARRRFEREARAAGRIDHPNVVDLYDVGEEGECSYLVMELLRGQSLRKRIAQAAVEPRDAIDLLIPAMRGVAAAHRAGVIHRDLKPDNIFICHEREGGQREIKVLDFGVSSITSLEAADSTLTQEGTLLGSLAYMSPEQLRNPHDVDARTDVYAFGVILFEVLTGELPFRGANQSALIIAITSMVPKRLSQIRSMPIALEEVVLRAMARERDERYTDMSALIEALVPFAASSRSSLASQPQVKSDAFSRQPGDKALPTAVMIASGDTTGAHGLPLRSRSPLIWIAASLLVLLAVWLLMTTWRSANVPVAVPSIERPPEDKPSAAPAPPSPLPPPVAPIPATARAPSLAAEPAPKEQRASTRKPEPSRQKPVRSSTKTSSSSATTSSTPIEAKEKSLFSGRK